ncbi:MAG: hypothetical protein WCV67_13370, partial [Victivallaceae bacterium]
ECLTAVINSVICCFLIKFESKTKNGVNKNQAKSHRFNTPGQTPHNTGSRFLRTRLRYKGGMPEEQS